MIHKKDVKYFQNKVQLSLSTELAPYEPGYHLPYILFGDLASLASSLIKKDPQNESLKKIVPILEEMVISEDEDVYDLFMVGFLEVFSDEESSVQYARKNLSKEINESLDIILRFWNRLYHS